MWEPAVSGTGNVHDCTPKLQAYPPIFSLTPKAPEARDFSRVRIELLIHCAHNEISILQYNNENSLSCTIHLAFYFAREYYTIIRELPTGKGFADVCFIPRKIAV